MRAPMFIGVTLRRDHVAGKVQAGEQVLVKASVPQAVIEFLDEAVLHVLAGRDGVPSCLEVMLPLQDRVNG